MLKENVLNAVYIFILFRNDCHCLTLYMYLGEDVEVPYVKYNLPQS